MRDSCFLKDVAEFRENTRVLTFPEGAEGIFVGIAGFDGSFPGQGEMRGILHEVDVAIGATSEAGAVFGVALRAEHSVPKSTTDGEPV